MDDQLLVRCYDVGLGDCIYLRIPDADETRHVLIDCGNKFGAPDALRLAIAHLESELPAGEDGRARLDLLVVTHPHEDHLKGIDLETLGGLDIRNIWLSACMDPEHPQREDLENVQSFAEETLLRLRDEGPNLALRRLSSDLLELSKADALEALFRGLPELNDIAPRYVSTATPEDELKLFNDPGVRLRVIAPMFDIDRFYLGRLPQELQALRGASQRLAEADEPADDVPTEAESGVPQNISRGDFERLRERMLENALAFTLKSSHLINNLSVVLLLEWHGRRLLFTGDAEAQLTRKGKFEEGKRNGSWNVMWANQHLHLKDPIDFLKVGHHGSSNATPWTEQTVRGENGRETHPINEILEAILPLPAEGETPSARAVVSTCRTNSFETIPDPALMAELGRRVSNVDTYAETPVKGVAVAADVPQPWRTDQKAGPFVELTFEPND